MINFEDITETKKLEPIKRRKTQEEILAMDLQALQECEKQMEILRERIREKGVAA